MAVESPLWCPLPSPPAVVMLCVLMIERSGAVEMWEAARGRDPRGRPASVSIQGLLTGMALSVWTQHRLQLSHVDRVLQGLDDPVLRHLGVRRHGAPVVIREGRRSQLDVRGRPIGKPKRLDSNVAEPLHRLSVTMATPLEWSPFAASKKSLAERLDAWRLQRRILDAVLFGFRPAALPPPDLLTIDATGIRSFGEPPDGDVDAGHVHQTPTRRDELALIYGYYGSALVGRNLDLSIEYPLVAFNYALTTVHDYGDNLDDVAILLLEAYKDAHGAGLRVVVDSAYAYKRGWARRVLALGFRSVHDTHGKDREWRGAIRGFQAMGEDLYCPVPHLRDLGSAVRDGVDLADYRIARDEQLRYRAQVVDVTPDGLTVICPAQHLPGEKPRVRCPMHQDSKQLSRATAPTISDPPAAALDCCAGPVSLEFAEHRVLAKAFQDPPYGSDAWREWWSPGRTGGEGKWGTLFGENSTDAVVGLTNWTEQARTAWAYAVALGVDNLQALRRSWFKPHVQQRLPADVREELAADPLLWPMDALTELYYKRFGG